MPTIQDVRRTILRAVDRGDPVEARVVADALIGRVLGLDRAAIYARLADPWPVAADPALAGLIARYRAGEPLAYLTGEREFFGRVFAVSPAVLIPRPETELLVEAALAEIAARAVPPTVADIGTGSGAIAVTLAAECPGLAIWAVDLAPEAIAVARANAARWGVAGRVRFLVGDLVDPLPAPVDLLIANLPYVPRVAGVVQAETAGHEPDRALDGGPDGLAVIRRCLERAPAKLTENGTILLEIGAGQADAVADLARRRLGEVTVDRRRDAAGHERVIGIRRRCP